MDEEIPINYCPIVNGTLTIPYGPKKIVHSNSWSDYYNHCEFKEVLIPDSVVEIGYQAFRSCKSLTSIRIPNSVKTIGQEAFYKCCSLKLVAFGDSVESIGPDAFSCCDNLHVVRLPRNVSYVGSHAFDCPVIVDEKNECFSSADGVLFNKDKTILLAFPRINGKASYRIPDGVKTIATSAFSGCETLRSVTMPDSMTTIEKSAFGGSGLKSVAIGNGVTEIGSCVFSNCEELAAVTMGNNVRSIGPEAFSYCNRLVSVELSDSVCSIGYDAFRKTPAHSIRIPKSTKEIGNHAFEQPITVDEKNEFFSAIDGVLFNKDKTVLLSFPRTSPIASYIVPDGVTTIGENAFSYCQNLKSIIISSTVKTIGNSAFYCCVDLKELIIPDNVETVEEHAFFRCYGLKSVTIGKGVRDIKKWTFYECTGLTELTIPNNVITIDDYAFAGCRSLKTVEIGDGVTSIGECAFYECYGLVALTLGQRVASIGEAAFCVCKNLQSVIMPDSVTSIGDEAFNQTALRSVLLPANSRIVGPCAFDCPITVDARNECLTSVDGVLYSKDMSVLVSFPRENGKTSFVIPDGVKKIGDYAFQECQLDDLRIPDSVIEIGDYAFYKMEMHGYLDIPNSVSRLGWEAFIHPEEVDNYMVGEYHIDYDYSVIIHRRPCDIDFNTCDIDLDKRTFGYRNLYVPDEYLAEWRERLRKNNGDEIWQVKPISQIQK